MPEGAVYVGRPSPWGNPFPISGDWIRWAAVALGYRADAAGRRAAAVELFRAWMTQQTVRRGPEAGDQAVIEYSDGSQRTVGQHVEGWAGFIAANIASQPKIDDPPDIFALRGKDLACWCPRDQPCHVDVLLELSNR